MPNWVYGNLKIQPDKRKLRGEERNKELMRLILCSQSRHKDEALDANNFIPMPEEIRKADATTYPSDSPKAEEKKMQDEYLTKKYGAKDWYEWSIINYGTKWGFCSSELKNRENFMRDGFLNYSFNTAWSPIYPVIVKMSKMFSRLTFIYYFEEESGEFRYRLNIRDGGVIKIKEFKHGK